MCFQNTRRVFVGVSNLESENARPVRQQCEWYATYATRVRLIGDVNENLTFRDSDERPTVPWERDKIAN